MYVSSETGPVHLRKMGVVFGTHTSRSEESTIRWHNCGVKKVGYRTIPSANLFPPQSVPPDRVALGYKRPLVNVLTCAKGDSGFSKPP